MKRCLVFVGLVVAAVVLGGCCLLHNERPLAGFSFTPRNPTVGQAVSFVDQSVDYDGRIVSWRWTFGDGSSSNLQNPSHAYDAPGTYTVQLTVTDNCGATDTATATVSVGYGGGGSGGGGGGGACQPIPSVSVWTDKTVYAFGETVTIWFSFNKHVRATLWVRLPNGLVRVQFQDVIFGPGTHRHTGVAGAPPGTRQVVLVAVDECGIVVEAQASYQVSEPAPIGP